jgi:hypothetical protein
VALTEDHKKALSKQPQKTFASLKIKNIALKSAG